MLKKVGKHKNHKNKNKIMIKNQNKDLVVNKESCKKENKKYKY